VDVITCAIFRDCRLRGVGVVRGVPSAIDLTRRSYNTGHTTVFNGLKSAVNEKKRKICTCVALKWCPWRVWSRPFRCWKRFFRLNNRLADYMHVSLTV